MEYFKIFIFVYINVHFLLIYISNKYLTIFTYIFISD